MIDPVLPEISQRKEKLLEKVIAHRTRHLVLVFQNVYQPLNASAAIRTAEIFGLQDVYIIEQTNTFKASVSVSRGALLWITIYRFGSEKECLTHLKQLGYLIVVTTLVSDAIPIDMVMCDKKFALVFGNELRGVSQYVLSHADIKTYIPMYGFTQSFNLSVSVGICLQELMHKVRSNNEKIWSLTDPEKESLLSEWKNDL